VRFTFSSSPAPTKRATSTAIPENSEEMKTMTTRKIWNDTPMAALAWYPTRLPTSTWSTIPCSPLMTLVTMVGHASIHTARGSGPSMMDRS
jgi:hypothetical protein